VKIINTRMFQLSLWKFGLWVRIPRDGHGIHLELWKRVYFSERYGYQKAMRRIGPLSVELIPKTTT
jgi:hypothetical protein